MKINSIRINNLASLESAFIDFSQQPLDGAGIFAITGPTGSGKSTILDAICLALYGKTPRYDKAREGSVMLDDAGGSKISQGDVKGILRDGSSEASAEVSFMGIDGVPYKAKWSVRRARYRADGKLQPDEQSLVNEKKQQVEGGGKKTDVLAKIEQVVGLNFEQFTRSVLLAQGDFTAFLKADTSEKSTLLEKLTGTTIYSEISKRIYNRHSDLKKNLEILQKQVEGIKLLKPEEKESLAIQSNELKAQVVELEGKIKELEKEIGWHEGLKAHILGKVQGEADWNKAIDDKENAIERLTLLKEVESIQPARPLWDAKIHNEKEIEQKWVDKKKLEGELLQKSVEKEKLTAEYGVCEKHYELHEKGWQDAQPLLKRARELDTIIMEKKVQLDKVREEHGQALNILGLKENELKEKRGQEEKLQNKLLELQQWKTSNQHRQALAEQFDLVNIKLKDAEKLLERQNNIDNQNRSNTLEINKLYNEIGRLEKNVSQLTDICSNLENEVQQNGIELEKIPIVEINQELNTLQLNKDKLIEAKGQWESFYQIFKDVLIINQLSDEKKKELTEKQESLVEHQNKQKEAHIRLEQTQKLWMNAKLQCAESVTELRKQLKTNEECFVCGSKKHPFVTKDFSAEGILDQLEQEFITCKTEHTKWVDATGKLEQACNDLVRTLENKKIELEEKTKKLASEKQPLELFERYIEMSHIPEVERTKWFQGEITGTKERVQKLQLDVKRYDELKTFNETKKGLWQRELKSLQQATLTLNDNKNKVIVLEQSVDQLTVQSGETKSALLEINQLLNPYFKDPEWFESWKKAPQRLLQAVGDFVGEWKKKTDQILQHEQLIVNVQSDVKVIEQLKDKLKEDVQLIGRKLADAMRDLDTQEKERGGIFAGEAANKVEARLMKMVEQSKQEIELKGREISELDKKILGLQTLVLQFDKNITELGNQLSINNNEIVGWIDEYNLRFGSTLTQELLQQQLVYDIVWINKERKYRDDLDLQITKAKATYDERMARLAEHERQKPSTLTLEEVTLFWEETKQKKNGVTLSLNEILFKLRQDEENFKRIGAVQKELDKKKLEFENWAKLNDLIGSADGKKFRQIAQEYTLDYLLAYANEHLGYLSKRYELKRIPNTLALQAMDKDMGNEVRTVYSLSGGESFLVSLALALGLASLSSEKMKVESLFIDEGFGSLDPETLHIAMDALERLHNQGRKVGVISHVQEMTDRIAVQIRVRKANGGKSEIEVWG